MIYHRKDQQERIKRYLKIPAKKKLEWLYEFNQFINKFSSKKTRRIRLKLRKAL